MYAINGPNWVELQPGRDVMIGDVASSYATVVAWAPAERAARGIKAIVDDPIPEGKVATTSALVNDNGTPRRAWDLSDAPPPPVPPSASAAQCRLALYDAGLLEAVEATIATHPYPPVRIWFGHAQTWERANPYVQALAVELKLPDSAVDELFRAAAQKG